MRVSTLDPITLNDVTNLDVAPFVIDGDGPNALKIYFESEENRQEYLGTPVHGSDGITGMKGIYEAMAENPDTGSIN